VASAVQAAVGAHAMPQVAGVATELAATNTALNSIAPDIRTNVQAQESQNLSQVFLQVRSKLRILSNNLAAYCDSNEGQSRTLVNTMRGLTEALQAQAGAFNTLNQRLGGLAENESNRQASRLARSVLQIDQPGQSHGTYRSSRGGHRMYY
jgi:hypothetical protein